jgi:CheY-like chemotaxis protein
LPQVLNTANKAPEARQSPPTSAETPLVLLIAHDPQDRVRITELLRNAGIAVETVATGFEAVARCHQSRFDAITLNLGLPDMSGRAVFEKIRERGFNQQTPVVMTIFAGQQGADIGVRVNGILAKPLSEKKLRGAIERCGLVAGNSQPIVVVDGDPSDLQLADELLRQAGYRVIGESDAASAHIAAAGEEPAALLLDTAGIEVIKDFKKTGTGRATPVIICMKDELTGAELDKIRAQRSSIGYNGAYGHGLVDELTRLLQSSALDSKPANACPSMDREVTHGSAIHFDRR